MKKLLFGLLLFFSLASQAQTTSEISRILNGISTDLFITGAASQSAAGNNILLASAGTGSFDAVNNGPISYRSFYVQVVGSAGISSGQILFEGSNDNVTFVPITWYDDAVVTGTPINAAISIAASTNRFFSGKITYRYFRCRISTVFAGGTVQAFVRYSSQDYVPRINTVGNPTAGNFNATVTATNLSTNIAQVGGTATPTNAGAVAAGVLRTVLTNDYSSTANIRLQGSTTNGTTTSNLNSAATTNATNLKATAGLLYSVTANNTTAAAKFIRFYNLAAAPTVGTSTPVLVITVPANSSVSFSWPLGMTFSTGIGYSITNAAAYLDATAVAAGDVQLTVQWQ